jgi:hypothetical protein
VAETASGPLSNGDISVTVRDTRSACIDRLIGNRGRSVEWRRQFTVRDVTVWPVTTSGPSQKPSNSSEVRDTRSASDAERPEGASGGFNVRGGWAGVRVSVDRTSVVDGGCRGRDSRRRRPCKRERFTARSVRPKIGRLPRGPALPLAPASAAARRPSASLRTDYRKMEKDRR